MHRRLNIVLAIAVSFVAISTIASAGGMPPDIAEKIAALGRGIAVPQTDAIYAPLHPMDPYPGVKVARDIKYGPADLNLLDIMVAENAADAPRPVLVLVHGGGFSRGTKKVAGSPFLDNIPLWAARNGMVGVNVDYRLAPQSPWPSGPEDMAAIVHWLKANIARYGGDPSRIYMMGWSAGANHVASYVAFPEFHAIAGSGLAGAILLSGSPFDPMYSI
jgi:acetyl esterase/lipase